MVLNQIFYNRITYFHFFPHTFIFIPCVLNTCRCCMVHMWPKRTDTTTALDNKYNCKPRQLKQAETSSNHNQKYLMQIKLRHMMRTKQKISHNCKPPPNSRHLDASSTKDIWCNENPRNLMQPHQDTCGATTMYVIWGNHILCNGSIRHLIQWKPKTPDATTT
jgi:hypothetical protein